MSLRDWLIYTVFEHLERNKPLGMMRPLLPGHSFIWLPFKLSLTLILGEYMQLASKEVWPQIASMLENCVSPYPFLHCVKSLKWQDLLCHCWYFVFVKWRKELCMEKKIYVSNDHLPLVTALLLWSFVLRAYNLAVNTEPFKTEDEKSNSAIPQQSRLGRRLIFNKVRCFEG